MPSSFKLLVFDWDGTLMDSEARIVDCVRCAARDLGLEVPPDRAIRNIIGLGLREAVLALFPEGDDETVDQVTQRYRHHFLNLNQTPSTLFEGAAETVQALAERGYLLAVATGKGRHGLDLVLDSSGLRPLFHATRCADETFSKPHPAMLEELMDELGAEPHETLMIGDTEYDLEMAVNARTHSLAVSYGVHESERLMRHRPLGCIDDIRKLLAWLDARPAL